MLLRNMVPDYGPIPGCFDQARQDKMNDLEWMTTYGEGWRENENPPESFTEYAGEYCRGAGRILDHGCGNGRFLVELAKLGICHIGVEGIDRSVEAVDFANARLREAGFPALAMVKSIYDLHGHWTYDAVISSQVMQYCGCWAKIKEAFYKMVCVMKLGAHLYLRLRSNSNHVGQNTSTFEDVYMPEEEGKFERGTNVIHRPYPGVEISKHNFTESEIRYLADMLRLEVIYLIEENNAPTHRPDGSQRGRGTLQWVGVFRKQSGRKLDHRCEIEVIDAHPIYCRAHHPGQKFLFPDESGHTNDCGKICHHISPTIITDCRELIHGGRVPYHKERNREGDVFQTVTCQDCGLAEFRVRCFEVPPYESNME